MTHEQLSEKAYTAYIETQVRLGPGCFTPLSWSELHQALREGYRCAVAAVQRSTSGSPKREAYAAFDAATKASLGGGGYHWEQLPHQLRGAWAAFTNLVIKEGALN